MPPAGTHRPQSVLDMGRYLHFHVHHNQAQYGDERYDNDPGEQPQRKGHQTDRHGAQKAHLIYKSLR